MQIEAYCVHTDRMRLLAGSIETVHAEISDRAALATLLEAEVPPEWPPDLNDLQMKELSVRWFENHPGGRGFLCWYFISLVEPRPTLVGIGGFSDVPDAGGSVEIGYSVLARYRKRGYATEAVRGLVAWAFQQPRVRRISAEIYPGYEVSVRVLEKNGFVRRSVSGDGVILYDHNKSETSG